MRKVKKIAANRRQAFYTQGLPHAQQVPKGSVLLRVLKLRHDGQGTIKMHLTYDKCEVSSVAC